MLTYKFLITYTNSDYFNLREQEKYKIRGHFRSHLYHFPFGIIMIIPNFIILFRPRKLDESGVFIVTLFVKTWLTRCRKLEDIYHSSSLYNNLVPLIIMDLINRVNEISTEDNLQSCNSCLGPYLHIRNNNT